MQSGLDESDLDARLQVELTLAQNGGEQTPKFGFQRRISTLDHLNHFQNRRDILNHEVLLEIELATDEQVEYVVAHVLVVDTILAETINELVECERAASDLRGR